MKIKIIAPALLLGLSLNTIGSQSADAQQGMRQTEDTGVLYGHPGSGTQACVSQDQLLHHPIMLKMLAKIAAEAAEKKLAQQAVTTEEEQNIVITEQTLVLNETLFESMVKYTTHIQNDPTSTQEDIDGANLFEHFVNSIVVEEKIKPEFFASTLEYVKAIESDPASTEREQQDAKQIEDLITSVILPTTTQQNAPFSYWESIKIALQGAKTSALSMAANNELDLTNENHEALVNTALNETRKEYENFVQQDTTMLTAITHNSLYGLKIHLTNITSELARLQQALEVHATNNETAKNQLLQQHEERSVALNKDFTSLSALKTTDITPLQLSEKFIESINRHDEVTKGAAALAALMQTTQKKIEKTSAFFSIEKS